MSIERRLDDLARHADESIRRRPAVDPGFFSTALRHRIFNAAVALVGAVVVVVGGVLAVGQVTRDEPNVVAFEGQGPAAPASELEVRRRVVVGPYPQAVAAGLGSVWVAFPSEDGDVLGELAEIDPSTGEVVDRTPLAAAPDSALTAAGAVWVSGRAADEGVVVRTVPATGASEPVALGDVHPREMAADGETLWVAAVSPEGDEGKVIGIDVTSGTIESEIAVPAAVEDVAARDGSVWVLGSAVTGGDTVGEATIYEIDQTSGEIVEAIAVGGAARSLAIAGPTLWVDRDGTTAVSIDRRSSRARVASSVEMGFEVFGSTSEGQLWFVATSPRRAGDAIAVADTADERFHVRDALDLEADVVDAAYDAETGSAWLIDFRELLIEVRPVSS